MTNNDDEKKIMDEKVGWTETVVLVCNQCGQQFGDDRATAPAQIKSELKAKVKTHFGKKVRVINTSCLNMCPVNKIAVVVARPGNEKGFFGYSVPVDVTAEEIFKKIFED